MEVSWPSAEQVKSEPEKSEHRGDDLIRFPSNHALIFSITQTHSANSSFPIRRLSLVYVQRCLCTMGMAFMRVKLL